MDRKLFWLPPSPLSAVDAFNRAALATGGVSYATKGAHADYNGHRYEVRWNGYKGYWTCGYQWSGWNVICRGSFAECLDSALRAHRNGGRGSSVQADLTVYESESKPSDLDGAEALLKSAGLEVYNDAALERYESTLPWQARSEKVTPHTRTGYAHYAVRECREQGVPANLFLEAESHNAWMAAVKAWKDERRRVSR